MLAAACTSGPPTRPPAVLPAAAWQDYAAARRLADAGDRTAAEQRLRSLMREHPRFISAHRAWQNLLLADHRRGELLAIYRGLRDADPSDPERWYLWGRVQSTADAQRSAFERALALEPRSPWPTFGQAMLDHAAGDRDDAAAQLRRLCRDTPGIPDFEIGRIRVHLAAPEGHTAAAPLVEGALLDETWDVERVLLVAECRERSGRPREALEVVGRLFARVPHHEGVARELLARLEVGGTVTDAAWLARELALVAERPLPALVLARCHALQGDAAAALAAWERATVLDAKTRARRRLLLQLRGEAERALADEDERFAALADVGADVSAFAAARTAAAALQAALGDGSGDATAERTALAQALLALGRTEEAVVVLRPTRGDGESAPAEFRSRLEQQRHVEAELKVLTIENYRRADASAGAGSSLDSLLAAIDGVTARTVGVPPIASTARRTVWPLGVLVEPDAAGLPRWFAERGQLLIAGQRRGHPAELFLAPVVAASRAGPRPSQLHWIEGNTIAGWLEHKGARFAGAALDRFAWIDVAAVEDQLDELLAFERRIGSARERLLADPVQPAADRAARVAVDEPAELAAKLVIRALAATRARAPDGGRRALLADSLDAVLAHETAHLADAARFLPLWRNGWSALPRLAWLGFSPRRVEEWLELRAQAAALAVARNPWLVLGDCAFALSGGELGGLTPHGEGYRALLERLVAVIDAAPADYPELDFGAVLLQQFDRLPEAKLRSAALRLVGDLDLDLADVAPAVSSPRAAGRSP